jgi:resuscitation-promoting factor RpfB
MLASRMRFAAVLLVLGGCVLTGLLAHKTVTLSIDGESQRVSALAFTIGQFLRIKGISLGAGDRLLPPAGQWLKNGQTIQIDHATQVLVRGDQETRSILTLERIPSLLLAQAGIPLYPGDMVQAGGVIVPAEIALDPAQERSIVVRRAVAIRLREVKPEGDLFRTYTSFAATLGQALWEAGIRLYTADRLSPPAETLLNSFGSEKALNVSLERSRELTIITGGSHLLTRSAAATVGQALADVGLSLQGLDRSIPAEDSPVPQDGKIRIIRVQESVIVEQSPLPFQTEYQPALDMEIDRQSILKTGEYGLVARRVRVRTEDGEEVSRLLEGEWTARQPQNRVVGYGTKIIMRTLNTPGGPIKYWRALRFWATSYDPNSAGGEITASGKKLRKGLVGVDRSLIPFGTRMYVPGYGLAEAADTGAIRGRWIDLGYSNDDYIAWHQWVTVYFLWPPPANPVWIFP